jgi:hypothetical protein
MFVHQYTSVFSCQIRYAVPPPFQSLSSIQILISFVTMISITSMPSVGSFSGAQFSILNACRTGEVGRDRGLEGTGDVERLKLGEGLRARSRRLTLENIA